MYFTKLPNYIKLEIFKEYVSYFFKEYDGSLFNNPYFYEYVILQLSLICKEIKEDILPRLWFPNLKIINQNLDRCIKLLDRGYKFDRIETRLTTGVDSIKKLFYLLFPMANIPDHNMIQHYLTKATEHKFHMDLSFLKQRGDLIELIQKFMSTYQSMNLPPPMLTKLIVSNCNNITNIERETIFTHLTSFIRFTTIRKLKLEVKTIQEITESEGLIQVCPNMTSLSIFILGPSFDNQSLFDCNIFKNPSIKKVKISSNFYTEYLSSILQFLNNNNNIIELNLKISNIIDNINGNKVLFNMNNRLKTLKIKLPPDESIPKELFESLKYLNRLEVLDIYNSISNIQYLQKVPDNLKHLVCYVSQDNIIQYSILIRNSKSLNRITLNILDDSANSSGNLVQLIQAITSIHSITSLEFSSPIDESLIDSILKAYNGLPVLKELYARNCKISSETIGLVSGQKNLQCIEIEDLYKNSQLIESIEQIFDSCKELRYFKYITYQNYPEIPKDRLNSLINRKPLDLFHVTYLINNHWSNYLI